MILGRFRQPNKYSLASLVGALEIAPALSDVQDSLQYEMTHDLPSEVLRSTDLADYDNIIVLLPMMSTQLRFWTREIAKLIQLREIIQPKIILVAGGPHPTYCARDVLQLGVDFVVRGEGEEALPLLIREIITESENWDSIPNLAHFGIDTLIQNPVHMLENFDDYPPYSIAHRLFSTIEITRGCPFGCYYCSVSGLFGSKVRHRSIDSIHKWLELAVQAKFDKTWFVCPNAFGYGSHDGRTAEPEIVKKMMESISSIPGLNQIYFGTFPSEVRPEFVTAEMIDACVPYISNKMFTMGAQSASDSLLERIHRQHTFQDVLNAMDLFRSRGFAVDLDFIFGLPGETTEDIEKNIEFFQTVEKTTDIRIHGHTFLPLPGTRFQNEPPGELAEEYKAILGRLSLKKKAYGSFLIQETRAKEISRATKH